MREACALMEMSEKAVLTDCLESLKHAASCYLKASMECDSDGLRKRLSHLAIDKAEESNAVFNMMHQADMYKTKPSDANEVAAFIKSARSALDNIGGPRKPVARELGRSDELEIRM